MSWLAKQKFRFDLGQGFLSVINFVFVVIAASDKISSLIRIEAKWLVLIVVPASIFFVWLMGYILDSRRFYHSYTNELNKRNEMLQRIDNRNDK
jgi:hypothetical protein